MLAGHRHRTITAPSLHHHCTITAPSPHQELDLEHLRKASPGLQPGETAMPDGGAAAAPAAAQFDEAVVNDLVQMGFPYEACKKAVIKTDNKGAEAA